MSEDFKVAFKPQPGDCGLCLKPDSADAWAWAPYMAGTPLVRKVRSIEDLPSRKVQPKLYVAVPVCDECLKEQDSTKETFEAKVYKRAQEIGANLLVLAGWVAP